MCVERARPAVAWPLTSVARSPCVGSGPARPVSLRGRSRPSAPRRHPGPPPVGAQVCWRPTVRQQRDIVQQARNGQHLGVGLQGVPLSEQRRPRPYPQAVLAQPDRHGLPHQFQRTRDRRRVGQFDAIGLQATPALPPAVRHGAAVMPLQTQLGDHGLHGMAALLCQRQAPAVGAPPGGRPQHRADKAIRRIDGSRHGPICGLPRHVNNTRMTRNGGTITKLRSNRKMPSRGKPRSTQTCR